MNSKTNKNHIKVSLLERAMLHKIARNEYTRTNGGYPGCQEDTCVWSNMIIETPQDKGVFTSLVRKNLVKHCEYGSPQDNLCSLTNEGLEVYRSLFKF